MIYSELAEKAKKVSENAYCKYSGFPVGACVMGGSGALYVGCNYENSSYGMTICAERNAVGSAIANGEKTIKACAIYSPKCDNCMPCGSCRQVLFEFQSEEGMDVITCNSHGCTVQKLDELLPHGFKL